MLGQREEEQEGAGRLGVEVSLATRFRHLGGQERAAPKPGGPARPAQLCPATGGALSCEKGNAQGLRDLCPLPCLSSPHFSRVSLPSWGTPLAGEAEGLGWGLHGPGVGPPTSYFSPSPCLCSPQPRGGGNGGPPSGPSKLLPATRPKQACGRPGFHIWHPSSAEEGDSAGGSPWAPCPPSPLAVLGSFLPPPQPGVPTHRGLVSLSLVGPRLGPGQPALGSPFTSCSPSRSPARSTPLSSLLPRWDLPAVGRVSNRLPSPSRLTRPLGWSHSCAWGARRMRGRASPLRWHGMGPGAGHGQSQGLPCEH